ncbi:PRK06851 family protein [Caminicella sporogenes]|nr:PRK06851 family protein [Caminicella sporogenes]
MITRGNVRRVFPGGNTYKGFYSYYDYILEQEEANRIIVIKGGPGVGKSSFMKKLGDSMEKLGFDVEYHHCSSDNNSIDGVVFKEIGVALIDGTAPHVVDPKNPGGVDEIIHLGDFWDESKMIENKFNIIKYNTEVGRKFKRAYGYLAAAKGIYDNIQANIEEAIDYVLANKITEQLIIEIFGKIDFGNRIGKERHLFGSAITPDGIKDYLETIIKPNETVYVLRGEYDSVQSTILDNLSKIALNKGYDVEIFHNHFIPEKIDHIVIKDISVGITVSSKFDSIKYKTIYIDSCLNKSILKEREEEIKIDKEKFGELINLAVENIGCAKKLHDKMETFYIPNMDFTAIDLLREKTLQKILKWAKR